MPSRRGLLRCRMEWSLVNGQWSIVNGVWTMEPWVGCWGCGGLGRGIVVVGWGEGE